MNQIIYINKILTVLPQIYQGFYLLTEVYFLQTRQQQAVIQDTPLKTVQKLQYQLPRTTNNQTFYNLHLAIQQKNAVLKKTTLQ
jgi:hypothetical protein